MAYWLDKPVEFRVVHLWGHGDWQPAERVYDLRAWVQQLNQEHGAGTHWLEARKLPAN
jgi:hypothetical protein